MSMKNKTRVVVAMSGGVDSSVAAALLKEEGYDVVGISLKVWDYEGEGRPYGKTCCSYDDIRDARAVCDRLEIPFYAFNYKNDFQEKVIRRFATEYYEGRTPNPCVLCNRHIKFDRLLDESEKLGAAMLATGHHARLCRETDGRVRLLKGVDSEKDQSYVLYGLTRKQLRKILLPVGEFTKTKIRLIAAQYGLGNAAKQESQDICFIPDRDHGRFLDEHFPHPAKKGLFVDAAGRILGEHEGIHHYTVGQRRGLGISFGERMYVVRIDSVTNHVVLGTRDDLNCGGLVARDINWITTVTGKSMECGVKIRYQKKEIPSVVTCEASDKVTVHFLAPYAGVSPGQSAVFYKGDEVIGGGIIERSF